MKVAGNVLGRHLPLAGNQLLKGLKQKKKLKLCAGWPGLWDAPAQGAGWSYGSPRLRVLGCRHGKALPVWSHTVHNVRCLLGSELGAPSMWNLLPIISSSLHGHSMNCWLNRGPGAETSGPATHLLHLLHQETEGSHCRFILCDLYLFTMTQSFLRRGTIPTAMAAQFLMHLDSWNRGNYSLGS